MASREIDQTPPHHQPLISSLVVRPTDSGGGGGAGGGSDYEPGEVRPDLPSYHRSDRFTDNHGYRMRAGSASPVRRRTPDRHYSPQLDRSGGAPRSRGFGRGRDPPRHRDYSPPYGRGRDGGRFNGRGLYGPGFVSGPFRGDGMPRNSPNVRPRDGDWICSDPRCANLNFARRESCNNCNRPRYGVRRGGYAGLPPPLSRRFPGPPVDRYPGRTFNGGYRSPPRSWARDGPRDLGLGGPPYPRREGRFSDHHQVRRDRPDYLDDGLRERSRFDRPISPQLDYRGRVDILNDRKGGYERGGPPQSPPPLQPPHRGRWVQDVRERSRSPPARDLLSSPKDYRRDLLSPPKDYRRDLLSPPKDYRRDLLSPPKDYRRDIYMERGRDDRRPAIGGRDRVGDAY